MHQMVMMVRMVILAPPSGVGTPKDNFLAAKRVKTQGKGSVLAAKAVEAQGKGSVLKNTFSRKERR